MGYRHLTDFEIQEALDGSLRRDKPLLQLHLDTCELCDLRLADYRKVAASLSSVYGEKVSAESSDAIMVRIASSAAHSPQSSSLLTSLGWIGAGLSAVASIGWVIARTDFANGVRQLGISYFQTASSQSDKILPLISNNSLAVAGVAALGAMVLLDNLIRRRVSGVNVFSI